MLAEASINIEQLSVPSRGYFKHINTDPNESRDASNRTVYLENVNLDFKLGDKVLLEDDNGYSKKTLIKVLAKEVPISKGNVEIQGAVFPGTNPAFGIFPRATLYQNVVLRGLKFGFSKHEIEAYCDKVFADKDLAKFVFKPYGEITVNDQILLLLKTLEDIQYPIVLVDGWIGTSSKIIWDLSKATFDGLINNSDISLVAATQQRLVADLVNKKVVFKNSAIYSVN